MDAPSDTSPSHLAELAARRFPLVARSQAISRPLTTRIGQIEAHAEQSRQGGPDGLLRAAEALGSVPDALLTRMLTAVEISKAALRTEMTKPARGPHGSSPEASGTGP